MCQLTISSMYYPSTHPSNSTCLLLVLFVFIRVTHPWRKSGQINQQRGKRNIKQIGIFSRCRTLHTVQDFTANKSAIYLSLTFWVNSTKRLFPSSNILPSSIETRVIDTPSVIGCYLFCQFYFFYRPIALLGNEPTITRSRQFEELKCQHLRNVI